MIYKITFNKNKLDRNNTKYENTKNIYGKWAAIDLKMTPNLKIFVSGVPEGPGRVFFFE